MVPISGFIKYEDNEVHCLRMGSGPKLLIAFHGFNNDAAVFEPLARLLQQEYTVISVDLPGHGKTRWNSAYMEKKALMAIVQGIRNNFGVEKFDLLGFSLGGRVVLNILELQPNWVDKALLLAADGMQKNFWYGLATRNPAGKIIFKKIIADPQRWISKMAWLRKYNLVDESRFKFAKTRLTDDTIRHQLSYVWPVMSRLIPNINLVKWNINKYKVTTIVVMGRHDRIFPPDQGERFIKNLKQAQLRVLDAGHNLVQEALQQQIAELLLPKTD
ncbi:alpha/beta fold hydrolase [Taibaiella chishuiensis]|uniref:Pimeloyl-ACP methyl ester carboxylesterase n=1 Tax=Taibaiella chishuiensis TaxID=1434707 RepID=A0A2P8CVU2_9BACT|nr:alpha/beta hydrolase [Taibaiella chishuiensis]PSK89077.1 pimeloyl-ACP methyl ester carboxylesterase [Taibaiella chishuiensis]